MERSDAVSGTRPHGAGSGNRIFATRSTAPPGGNLRGRLWRSYDGAGLSESLGFDFAGNLIAAARHLVADDRTAPDWAALDGLIQLTEPKIGGRKIRALVLSDEEYERIGKKMMSERACLVVYVGTGSKETVKKA